MGVVAPEGSPSRAYGLLDCDCALLVGSAVFSQMWSPIAAISISLPQSEHLMAGKKLAGLKPPAASVEASGIVVLFV